MSIPGASRVLLVRGVSFAGAFRYSTVSPVDHYQAVQVTNKLLDVNTLYHIDRYSR